MLVVLKSVILYFQQQQSSYCSVSSLGLSTKAQVMIQVSGFSSSKEFLLIVLHRLASKRIL